MKRPPDETAPDFTRIQRLTTLLHSTADEDVKRECRRRLAVLRKKREAVLRGEYDG